MIYNVPGKMAAIVTYGDRAFGMLAFRSPALTYDYQDLEGQRNLVAEAFESADAWHFPALLEGIIRADDFYFDSVSQVRMPKWSQGRVALGGDSAYCSSFFAGMCTSLALMGSSHLTAALAASDDHGSAFAHYEETMRPHVQVAQESVPTTADFLIPNTWSAIEARNEMVRQDTAE